MASAQIVKTHIALAQHDVEAACIAARQALELDPPDDADHGWRHAEAQGAFGECLNARGQITHARDQLQSSLATLQRVRGADHWMTRHVREALRALPKV